MKIAVAGIGYVGLSSAMLLSQNHEVIAIDINSQKVKQLNNKISPIQDAEIVKFLTNKKLNFLATLDKELAYKNADFAIIATPTDYDPINNFFDTSSVEAVIEDITKINSQATIIIKSTVPVGFTKKVKNKFKNDNIIFSPEFLREGYALHDNLYPSRIIIGEISQKAKKFASLLEEGAKKDRIDILFVGSSEAEAIKLFSNTYLAMRVAYFNELDTYAEIHCLDTREIIEGVGLDSRIGNHYNNPSFGYGGYCLPKDIKQLLDNYKNIPSDLIKATINSNTTRKEFIANSIINKKPKTVGVYRLAMKTNSDNFRESAMLDIIKILVLNKIDVILYEPHFKKSKGVEIQNIDIIDNLDKFINNADLIIANRMDSEIEHVSWKVYTRDIFREN